jgi:hypothetical protein
LVEGVVDEAIVLRLLGHVGAAPGPVYGKQGKPYLRKRIGGFNNMARSVPLIVLVDLNNEYDCAPLLVAKWLPHPSSNMCFRVVVRQLEAWLMGDRERLSAFLSVSLSRVPTYPDREPNPKDTMVELARRSRKRAIREDMVPSPQSGRRIGPAYASRLIEFASDSERGWRPDVAAQCSESLRRCLVRLREFVQRTGGVT